MKPIEITDDNFADVVLNSDKLVILYFWHHQCGPCRAVSPKIDVLAAEYGERVTIGKTNVRETEKPAQHFKVFGVPAVLFLCNGEVKNRIHGGAEPLERIKLMIDELLSCASDQQPSAAAAQAKQELDAAIAAAQTEFERACREAGDEYSLPTRDLRLAMNDAWKPIADERDRLLAGDTAKRDSGEITVDEWFAAMVECTNTVMADERFQEAVAAYNELQTRFTQESAPHWKIYEEKQAAAETAFNDAVRAAKERYQSALSA